MKRSATAIWNGTGKEGTGTISTESTTIKNAQYTYKTRFVDEVGTNPEELIAAAHAGCFTMKLSFVLGAVGFTPDQLETQCNVLFEGGVIKGSHLSTKGKVPGITAEKFQECAAEAKATCPVSKALSIEISFDATLL